MLSLMSVFDEEHNFKIFLKKYKDDETKIFTEIYKYLGSKDFKTKQEFKHNYKKLLSKEKNQSKVLQSGLILQYDKIFYKLFLTDKNFTFKMPFEFLKKILIKNKQTNKMKQRFIISETYFSFRYNKDKKNTINYKLGNSNESSLFVDNFSDIIYNDNLEYITIEQNFDHIFDEIFDILKKEKAINEITPSDLFNEYRLLNFPEIKKKYIGKITWKSTGFEDYCYQLNYLYYNRKIGLSLALQKKSICLLKEDRKHFYCNIDFLINEKKTIKIRNYLFFYLSFLFSIEKKNEYKNFIKNNIIKLINDNKGQGDKLIEKLLELLKENFQNFKLYIDNVKTIREFNIIKHFMDENAIQNILIFIQINSSTLTCVSKIYDYGIFHNFEIGPSIEEDLENYLPLTLGLKSEIIIKNNYCKKLKPLFERFDTQSYINLLNIKKIISLKASYLDNLVFLDTLLDFLLVKIKRNSITKITFRNDFIKELFNNYYNEYIVKFKSQKENIFYEITKTEEGINFESQIIYDLIISNNKIKKIEVDKIFCLYELPEFEFKIIEEYLFTQKINNSPYYDIGYLYYYNGLIILKCAQIGINKDSDELKKLNKAFLLFDLYYFCQKIKTKIKVNIDKIELCLITTMNAYEENKNYLKKIINSKDRKYPNFNTMKKFCENNEFNFLIFNTKDSEFYRYKNDDELEKTDLKYSKFQFDVKRIFLKNEDILESIKKDYYFNPKKPDIIGKIKFQPDFNIENLNKEFNFEINDGEAIYKIKNNNLCINTKKNKLFKEEHQHQFNELNDSESCDSLVEYESEGKTQKVEEDYSEEEDNSEEKDYREEEDYSEEEDYEEKSEIDDEEYEFTKNKNVQSLSESGENEEKKKKKIYAEFESLKKKHKKKKLI